jgi:hypothetical protein
MTEKPDTLAAALADLDAARRRVEARLAREEQHAQEAGTAAALTHTYASDFELVAIERKEQRLRAEQAEQERSAKSRAAFGSMLDDLFEQSNPNPITNTGNNAETPEEN